MKKILMVGGIAMMMGLTACESDFTNKESNSVGAINLITNLTDQTTTISDGIYGYSLEWDNKGQRGYLNVSNLILNGQAVNFQTLEQSYEVSANYTEALFKNVESTTQNISNSTFVLTPWVYVPIIVNGDIKPQFAGRDIVIGQYQIGNYQVKTFYKNTFYMGKTVSTYPSTTGDGTTASYTTDGIYYVLDLSVNKDTQAIEPVIYMYNAKFTDTKEPIKKQIIVDEGLTLNYSNGILTVEGTDIIPKVVMDAGDPLPNPSWIFNSIKFQTTSTDLVNANISFQVAGKYRGSFNGVYAVSSFLQNNSGLE